MEACASLHEAVILKLSTPRERLGSQRSQWLENWHLPSEVVLQEAERLAESARARHCNPVDDASATLANLRLYLAPCTAQCLHLPAAARRRCACRACASTSWTTLVRLCMSGSALVQYMDPSWCRQVRQLSTDLSATAIGGGSVRSAASSPARPPLWRVDSPNSHSCPSKVRVGKSR